MIKRFALVILFAVFLLLALPVVISDQTSDKINDVVVQVAEEEELIPVIVKLKGFEKPDTARLGASEARDIETQRVKIKKQKIAQLSTDIEKKNFKIRVCTGSFY